MRTGQREGKELHCPFCKRPLPRPVGITVSPFEKAEGGKCECGAIYLSDTTGKNLGEIMLFALGMAADTLSKDAMELVAGEDYEEIILSYDWRTHQSRGISSGFRAGQGRLYMIKPRDTTA